MLRELFHHPRIQAVKEDAIRILRSISNNISYAVICGSVIIAVFILGAGFLQENTLDAVGIIVNIAIFCVAFKGLSSWRKQTQETHRADFAKRLIHETYEVSRSIEIGRNCDELEALDALKYLERYQESYKCFCDLSREFAFIYNNKTSEKVKEAIDKIHKLRRKVYVVRERLSYGPTSYASIPAKQQYLDIVHEIWPKFQGRTFKGIDIIGTELAAAKATINDFATKILREYYGTENH